MYIHTYVHTHTHTVLCIANYREACTFYAARMKAKKIKNKIHTKVSLSIIRVCALTGP